MDDNNIISELLTPENIELFKKGLEDQQPENINQDQPKIKEADSSPDQQQNNLNKKKPGRKNRGLTEKSYKEYKDNKKETYHNFMHTKSPDNFNAGIIERVQGEIISDNDLSQFKELYSLTCESILTDFKQNNPELVKKHPYYWFKPLLLEIKKNVQKITAHDIDKCFIVWDCLSDLLYSIGLYPTFELFQYMTNIYKYQLKNLEGSSPKYIEFLKKISNDADSALISELSTSPYNSTNKIFLAKVHGIIEKTEPKQIEITHNIGSYNNISRYRLEDQQQN